MTEKELEQVSIPAWCDWEQYAIVQLNIQKQVSIPAWCDWERRTSFTASDIVPSFNSSLVRLGVIRSILDRSSSIVSIPAWCDWEAGVYIDNTCTMLLFQFQLGAIGRGRPPLRR